MQQRLLQEFYDFTHKDITVTVKIDYYNNRISLMEHERCVGFSKKQWMFADRGVEYVSEWLVILEAMGEAMKDAKKKYEKQLEITSGKLTDTVLEALTKKNKK